MAGSDSSQLNRNTRIQRATTEGPWVRALLMALAVGFLVLFLFVPVIAVFVEALKKGLEA